MIAAGLIAGAVAAGWLLLALVISSRHRISRRQAALYAPFHLLWRIDSKALRRACDQRSVIYVVSHQSRLDPALMLALLPSDTLHLLDEASARAIWLEPWRELARTISFDAKHVFLSRRLVRILRGGGRICVYMPPKVEPDSRTFRLYRAVARIALKAEARVVPVYIDGARHLPGSLTERAKAPRNLLQRLSIHAPAPATIPELRAEAGPAASTASNTLFDYMAETRFSATDPDRTLFGGLSRAATTFGTGRIAVEDATGQSLTYRRLMIATRVLADRFASMAAQGDVVGLLLPNAAPTAAAFFGLQSAGCVAAMLNYTAGPATMALAVRTGSLRIVVSSHAFVQKAQLGAEIKAIEDAGARVVYLEDLRAGLGNTEKLLAALGWRRPVRQTKAADPAVMLFTSGSEGAPKGVLLSHRNLVANTAQVEARIGFSPLDTLFNVLPVFHAFGLTGGMILPLFAGVRLYLYLSPLHYKQIPETAAKVRPTILFGTDTFLAAYARTAAERDFESVRLIVAGAEAVRGETRRVWRERFGAEIVEGFGMTECSPVVAVNTATHGRDGTVGRLLPAIRARLEPVDGIGDAGRLLVKGPNVMLGYRLADRPGDTVASPGGWHDSGDIVSFDKDGFITIRGRARRFAKIAGEMVSLSAVEMLAQAVWPEDKHAAVALPDERKGERIVLVTTAEPDRNTLRAHAKAGGVGELTLPAQIVRAPDIPVLGTGKTDYSGVKLLAEEAAGVGRAA